MNWIDFLVVFAVIVLVALAFFFGPFLPYLKARNKGMNPSCSSCPVGNQKKAKRLINDFHKEEAKRKKAEEVK
ncbi:MAG: hypothetical protein LKJ88_01455 [Bacilli bacterium]|jgi:hypothetical protein|nr:hypothetical protein [Bacilli bacterium]